VHRRSLAAGVAALLLVYALSLAAPAKVVAADQTLPLEICLGQPAVVQGSLRCPHRTTQVPRGKDFYVLVAVTAQAGLGTYGLDWFLDRWQPKARRWAVVRKAFGVKIQPDWQFTWLHQKGLSPGSYRAHVRSDFLATLTNAPSYAFAARFTVR